MGDPAGLRYFEDEGYVVYKDVLSAAETATTLSKQWDFMEVGCHPTATPVRGPLKIEPR